MKDTRDTIFSSIYFLGFDSLLNICLNKLIVCCLHLCIYEKEQKSYEKGENQTQTSAIIRNIMISIPEDSFRTVILSIFTAA